MTKFPALSSVSSEASSTLGFGDETTFAVLDAVTGLSTIEALPKCIAVSCQVTVFAAVVAKGHRAEAGCRRSVIARGAGDERSS